MVYFSKMPSLVGEILIVADGKHLLQVSMQAQKNAMAIDSTWEEDPQLEVIQETKAQLTAYFEARLEVFDLPIALQGTPFQVQVWKELQNIPYGKTISYGDLALRIGNAKASRAVGLANGKNPIAIIIPCHRVIGSSGSLTGYGGGLGRKKQLLDLEAGDAGLFHDLEEATKLI